MGMGGYYGIEEGAEDTRGADYEDKELFWKSRGIKERSTRRTEHKGGRRGKRKRKKGMEKRKRIEEEEKKKGYLPYLPNWEPVKRERHKKLKFIMEKH